MAKNNLAIIIVAAGSSSRLGQPKQLVELSGVSLLKRISHLAATLCDNVYCVLGYQAIQIQKQIFQSNIQIVVNKDWQLGMGTSIASGVEALSPSSDGVLILLCDQWAIERDDLIKLIDCWQQKPLNIVASCFSTCSVKDKNIETQRCIGSPAVFPKTYFERLKKLKDSGAKKLIQNNNDVITVDLDNAQFDLDTPEALEKLKQIAKSK